MFGKIKGKLKGIFDKNEEEIIEENFDEEVEKEDIPTPEDISEEKESKGFLGGLFSKKKDEEEVEEVEKLEEVMLKDVPEEEKDAIKEHKDLDKKEVDKNKKNIEKQIKKEKKLEKETQEDIPKPEVNEVEEKLGEESKEDISEEKESKGFLGGIFSKKKKEEEEVEEQDESTSEVEKSEFEKRVEHGEDNLGLAKNGDEVEEQESSGIFKKAVNLVKKKKINEEDFFKLWTDLEIFLLEINVAYEIVEKIQRELKHQLLDHSFDRFALSKKIREVLISEVEIVLGEREGDFLEEIKEHRKSGEPLKIMVLGVNGTGKTTSIGKIIKFLQDNNLSVVVGAADTFRAAAVDQIETHCKNLGVKCIKHQDGSDPAAVAFDAVSHAKAKNIDVVLIDTAGRMPNNSNLMSELEKVKRVSKADMGLFIGDSISGNDLIEQINLFDKGVEINGVVLTKVDTDERPGSVVTCAYSIKKPIYFLGIGQDYKDLVKFDSKEVAEKLFDVEEE